MSFNWNACQEIGPGKYVIYVIKHITKNSVYNNVSYPTPATAQDIIDFDGIKDAKVVSMVVSRHTSKGGKKSEDFDD